MKQNQAGSVEKNKNREGGAGGLNENYSHLRVSRVNFFYFILFLFLFYFYSNTYLRLVVLTTILLLRCDNLFRVFRFRDHLVFLDLYFL